MKIAFKKLFEEREEGNLFSKNCNTLSFIYKIESKCLDS